MTKIPEKNQNAWTAELIYTSTLAALGMCLCDEHTNTVTAVRLKKIMQISALQVPRFTTNIPKGNKEDYYYKKGEERYESSDC